ncbi:hypothetical protein AV274_2752 [Blastocystis sp. ATCC 50177/Nand II]|uniref:Uncharacterized protein n=1 Tax=Blastocystis sp. subtype 1 (strain ATCC 50177 / NandII) TaxID=478820 RepID=A0A196SHA4_BLAHN|nr:hypothetical protein AV274_2752 [Blastocystis sp. ATCC 50177/Nand II]
MTVVILGLLPTSCSLCLDFVERVVLFDSDLIPSTDFEYLKSKFHITMHRHTTLLRLVTAASLEMACYYPSRVFLNQFAAFINSSSVRFTDSLLSSLFMPSSAQYCNFTSSKYNMFFAAAITAIPMDGVTHCFSEEMMLELNPIAFPLSPSKVHGVVVASTIPQQLLESVWSAQSFEELEAVHNRIIQNLPSCIRTRSMSLVTLDTACLEACSQMDLCMCHFMNRLLDVMGGEGFGAESVTRKKTSKAQGELSAKTIPMFSVLKDYLCRIRLAMRYNNYWVICPYQDVYRLAIKRE